MGIYINTRLDKNYIALTKEVLALTYPSMESYLTYLFSNLLSTKIVNPVDSIEAQAYLQTRVARQLLHSDTHKIALNTEDESLNLMFLTNLNQDLRANTFWDVNKICDYAFCQLLTNPASSFTFGFNAHEASVIRNVLSKYQLQKLHNDLNKSIGDEKS